MRTLSRHDGTVWIPLWTQHVRVCTSAVLYWHAMRGVLATTCDYNHTLFGSQLLCNWSLLHLKNHDHCSHDHITTWGIMTTVGAIWYCHGWDNADRYFIYRKSNLPLTSWWKPSGTGSWPMYWQFQWWTAIILLFSSWYHPTVAWKKWCHWMYSRGRSVLFVVIFIGHHALYATASVVCAECLVLRYIVWNWSVVNVPRQPASNIPSVFCAPFCLQLSA